MKITPIGRGGVLEIYSDLKWSNGSSIVLDAISWYEIERWCRKSKIYYAKTGNTIQFFKESDVTAFMIRWA